MFYVYVLRSESDSGFYIGFSTNLRARLRQHQDGESFATKSRRPWKLVYYEAYLNQEDRRSTKQPRERTLLPGAQHLSAELRSLRPFGNRFRKQFQTLLSHREIVFQLALHAQPQIL